MKAAASFEANSSVPLAKIERALFMMLVFHIEHPHCRRMGEIDHGRHTGLERRAGTYAWA